MAKYRKVLAENLVPGSIYFDYNPESHKGRTVKMEYLRREKGAVFFKRLEGPKCYLEEAGGEIAFIPIIPFYEQIK